jgi:hypothetical protein
LSTGSSVSGVGICANVAGTFGDREKVLGVAVSPVGKDGRTSVMDDLDHNYLDDDCSSEDCGYQAVEQDWFKPPLCLDHLKEEIEWDKADRERE